MFEEIDDRDLQRDIYIHIYTFASEIEKGGEGVAGGAGESA